MSIGSRLVIQPEKSLHILVQYAPQKERGRSVRPVPGLPEWPEVADSAGDPFWRETAKPDKGNIRLIKVLNVNKTLDFLASKGYNVAWSPLKTSLMEMII